MRTKTLLRFDEIPEDALMVVGGKGASLGNLWRSSFPVPDGFCLTSAAFEWFLEENQLSAEHSATRQTATATHGTQAEDGATMRTGLLNGRFPSELREEILEAYQALINTSPAAPAAPASAASPAAPASPASPAAREAGAKARVGVAVRSSATAEDLPQASFAGQQETFLNVQTPEGLLEAIRACYASLYGERAVAYRREAGFGESSVSMAVVVQKMIEADVSGVLFTVDPLSQDADRMMINASFGLGESVVSGHVTPDFWLCDKKTGAVISQNLGSKETMIVYGSADTDGHTDKDAAADGASEGPGVESGARLAQTRTLPVPAALQSEFCLDAPTLKDLVALAAGIERHYGCPQDIEWALAGGRLFILQSRAITTLSPPAQQATPPSLSSPSLSPQSPQSPSPQSSPLAQSPSPQSSSQARSRTPHRRSSGLNAAAERAMMNNLIEHCPEPLYPLEFVPLRIMEAAKAQTFATLGIVVGDEFDFDADGQLYPAPQKVRLNANVMRLPGTLKRLLDFADNQKTTATNFVAIRAKLHDMEAEEVTALSEEQLLERLDALLEASRVVAHIRFRHNIFPFVILSKLLGGRFGRIRKGLTEYDLLVELPYLTACMNERLSELAQAQVEAQAQAQALEKPEGRGVQEQAEVEAEVEATNARVRFRQEYAAFLNDFGWKSTASYLPFGSTSFNEDPRTLERLLAISLKARGAKAGAEYAEAGELPCATADGGAAGGEAAGGGPKAGAEASGGRYAGILQRIDEVFRPRAAKRLRERIEQLRTYHVNREESLYLLETCYGLMRRFVRELARRNPATFLSEDDIRFLMMEELFDRIWLDDSDACRALIKRRQATHVVNSALWNEMEISAKADEAGALRGTSGNRGMARGRARVILSLDEFPLMQDGEVLVCRYTDPAWTPLFSLAAAVVSDTGGPLSHSAIVAREYGIPAVLGCGNATRLICSGDTVLVDGSNGRVHIR
ncbi:MAG: hypothetical protein LBO07_03540 [Coriobacteriales bacterium]|jgi:pyruvate,water dikinase|nr:hypothetical protein [Coriobacteriales bacterium]